MNSLMFSMVILLCGVAATQAVECYTCSSILGSNLDCEADPFNTTLYSATTTTCDGSCKKEFGTIDGVITSMVRSCETSCTHTGCSSFFGIGSCALCCDDELCNGAEFVTGSRLAIMVATVSTLLFLMSTL